LIIAVLVNVSKGADQYSAWSPARAASTSGFGET
jgi:hypothetical protein